MDEVKITLRRFETPNGFVCTITSDYFGDTIDVESNPSLHFSIAETEVWRLFLSKIKIGKVVPPDDAE